MGNIGEFARIGKQSLSFAEGPSIKSRRWHQLCINLPTKMASFYEKDIVPRARINIKPEGGFTKETYDRTVTQYWQAKNDKCAFYAFVMKKEFNDAAAKYEHCKDILYSFFKVNKECPSITYYPNSSINENGEELPKNYMDFAE